MRPTRLVVAACITASVLVGPVAVLAREGGDEPDARIARLIRQLGSDRWREREAATQKLIEIGLAALPAVRKAIADPDLEISLRAMRICRRLTEEMSHLIAAELARARALRAKAQVAFEKGRYEQMGRLYAELAGMREPDPLDVIWLGHAHQLAGDWANAAAAYEKAAKSIAELLKKKLADDAALPPWLKARGAGAREIGRLRDSLTHQRAGLTMLAARIQRGQLNDRKLAAARFAEAQAILKDERSPAATGVRGWMLRESADSWERAGEIARAIECWARIHRLCMAAHMPAEFKPHEVARLLQKLPPGKAPPPTPGVVVLSPEGPRRRLDLDEAKTADLASLYLHSDRKNRTTWKFAIVPHPGVELARLTVEADMATSPGDHPAGIYCSARLGGKRRLYARVGSLELPGEGSPVRKVLKRTFQVPVGADLVELSTSGRDEGRVHHIAVAAKFRRRRPVDREFLDRVKLWTEFEPPAGKPLQDGQVIKRMAERWVKPGRHVFEYEHPDRTRKFRCAVDLAPGGRYSLFVNLDSGFESTLTNLSGIRSSIWPRFAHNSFVRLPDGRWLLAYRAAGGTITLSTSRDLVKWEKPWPMPFSSVFVNCSPALFVDRDGTIWLAWFSNRLKAMWTCGVGRYQLWRSRSRDGRDWSRPLPVPLGMVTGSPEPVQMLRDSKGKCWMFWRHLVASGDSPGKMAEPSLIDLAPGQAVRDVRVALDENGRMHVVFGIKDKHAIYYSASADGRQWTEPVPLVQAAKWKPARYGQLIVKGGRACLIYKHDRYGYVCPVTLGKRPKVGEPGKISNLTTQHVTTAAVTRDGYVVLLAGDAVWLLKAKLEDLLRQAPAD